MDAIFKRRSIRRFKDQPVPEEAVRRILSAAMNAPSAGNEQPWHFIVVTDKQMLRKLGQCGPYASSAGQAPAAVVVCGDVSLQRHEGYWDQDCSAAVENMLLEAVALGLGAVWLSVYPPADRVAYMKELFSLPESVVPFAIVPFGYPSQEMPMVDRYNESRVHRGGW